MDAALFAKSLVLGLAVAAPVGPIGALCISRTLERGFAAGVAGGLGTAVTDAVYAALAAFGFAAFSAILSLIDVPMRILGGLFMLWLGAKGLRAQPADRAASVGHRDLLGTTAATFALTIVNPATIIAFAAMFAGLGLAEASGWGSALIVTLGVFLGSMLWWVILSGGVAFAGRRLPPGFARAVSLISGATLILFGLYALSSALLRLLN